MSETSQEVTNEEMQSAYGEFVEQIRTVNNGNDEKYKLWIKAMTLIEETYNKLILLGASAQEARSVLPNSLKTEIVVTMNLREWLHFFELRTGKDAHPQMREIAIPLLEEFKRKLPVIFSIIKVDEEIKSL